MPLTPEALERARGEGLQMLAAAGWTGDEDGFDFSREGSVSEDLISE